MRWIAALLTTGLMAGSALAVNATNYTTNTFQAQQNHYALSQLEETRTQTQALTTVQQKQDAQLQAIQALQKQQAFQIQLLQQQIQLQRQLIQLLQARAQVRDETPVQ